MEWWQTWAPYWDQLERRHFDTAAVDQIPHLNEPVLVIGAGQGLVVEHLQKKGLQVDGVDLEQEMVRQAFKRRHLTLLRANATALPLSDKQYNTVFFASGVIDYCADENQIRQMLAEARRVLTPAGDLYVSFFDLPPKFRKIYQNIGIVDRDGSYRLSRLFELFETLAENPLLCVRKIVDWTDRSYLPTLMYWSWLGLTLPRELKDEHQLISQICAQAQTDGIEPQQLYRSAPAAVPFRRGAAIERLLQSNGLTVGDTIRTPDLVICHCLSSRQAVWEPNTKITNAPSESDNWSIRTRQLCKRYQNSESNVVDELSLQIPHQSIFGILGPNGAGKTTTLLMLADLMPADSGEIDFAEQTTIRPEVPGERLATGRLFRQRLGLVPQDLAVYEKLTARENLMFFGRLYGVKRKNIQHRIDSLLSLIGLSERADDAVSRYSTGMKRRLNLAIGLIHNPQIVLLDEPTVGIDPQSRNCIFEAVLALRRNGATILYTTHYMEEASRLCDWVAIMDIGRVVVQGPPQQLVQQHGKTKIEFYFEKKDDFGWVDRFYNHPGVCQVDLDRTGGNLTLAVDRGIEPGAVVRDAMQLAGQLEISLSLKRVSEPDLESLFLDITGHQLRDNGDSGGAA